jgi:signal transduction histidine kinase
LAEAIDSDGRTRLMILRKLLSLLFVVLVAIVGWAGWFYSGRALAPIKKVMSEVERISTVNLSHRLQESKNPDEIGKLVIIFNHLLSRIDNAFTLQKTFVSNVSHELKNPLTKITSQLEVTLFKDRLATEYKETIQSVLEDIKELNHLSNSLLDLASLSQPEVSISTTKVRIDEILWEIRDIVQSINPAYKVNFHTVSMPLNEADLYLQANSHLLKIAIQNLIENACKFSDDNVATVSLFCSPTELEIRIFDKGPGIEPTELQNIFQPFYRSNKTSQVKGHGIGLSLSQRIIDLHNGAIEIESTLGEGTQVTVVFYTQL